MPSKRTLYRPVYEKILSALTDIFQGGFPADQVIQRHIKANRKWGSHDRRLFAEAVYDIVRWWRRLGGETSEASQVVALWCSLHEVSLDQIPAPARGPDVADLPRAVRESIPDWLDHLGEAQLGSRWDEILPVLNTVAPVYLRANRLKTTAEKLVARLSQEGIASEAEFDDCLKLKERSNVYLTKAFAQGWFEVQDAHSQKVAPALQVEPGQRVVDACAGGGGKSLHLASLMGDKGKIIALDVVEKKLAQLRERATRNGCTSIEARLIEGSKTIKRLKDSADRLLLDVPCSGTGVLRRNPDSKWRLNINEVSDLQQVQAQILSEYCGICRPGGLMVYATCSILPSENEQQIEKFLSQNETWKLEESKTYLPEHGGGDGFFIARLRRS